MSSGLLSMTVTMYMNPLGDSTSFTCNSACVTALTSAAAIHYGKLNPFNSLIQYAALIMLTEHVPS